MLVAEDAQVLYRYGDSFYTDYAAITRKACKKGMIYYVGCAPDGDTLAALMGRILDDNGIGTISSEPGVEIVTRGEEGNRIRMMINHNDHRVKAGDGELEAFKCKIIRE